MLDTDIEQSKPTVYWHQTDDDIFLRIGINNPQGTKIRFTDSTVEFSAYIYDLVTDGPLNFDFTLHLYESTDREENVYELIDQQLQFVLRKKTPSIWPRLCLQADPSWIVVDSMKNQERHDLNSNNSQHATSNNVHREELETRDVHEDYPHMYDELHKAELGYRKEELKKVYLVLYNLCQFIGFIYILTIMTIRYSREGPDSMRETYKSVGGVMKFIQLLQFLEVMHPMFGYTKGNTFVAFLQVSGRAFVVFAMIDAEPRMQPKPVVFYLFFIWSLIEIVRYPYYITQLLHVEIPLLTWLRYTMWIPLYPLGFLCEGTIVLRNIPYFEETQKFTVSLPNPWNFTFHLPNFLRIYLLLLAVPGMYTMMSHMHRTRYRKLGRKSAKSADNGHEEIKSK